MMQKLIPFFCFYLWIGLASTGIAQAVDTTQTYLIVDEMPHFPDGPDAFRQYIKTNLHLPRVIGQPLRVDILFTVERDGRLTNIRIQRHAFDTRFDDEALRIVKLMPRWIAGRQHGVEVKVEYMQPILFKP